MGVYFVKNGKWGVFSVKKWKMGGCCKKWTFPQRRVHYGQYQYFLFYILLIWGVAYAPNATPPLPTGLQSFADAPNKAGMDDKLLSLSGYFGLGPGLRLEAIIRNLLRSS